MIDVLLGFLLLLAFAAAVFFGWGMIGLVMTRVPFVSTDKAVAQKMVELAQLRPGQNVYDLGCGSGTILFLAEKYGARCTGYELVRPVYWLAQLQKTFRRSSVAFRCQDFFQANLSDGDVIFCYLFRPVMNRLYAEKWPELKPGTKLISHGFPIDELKPVHVETVRKAKIYVYQR